MSIHQAVEPILLYRNDDPVLLLPPAARKPGPGPDITFDTSLTLEPLDSDSRLARFSDLPDLAEYPDFAE